MDLRQNINRVHGSLLQIEGIGETVTIKEASSQELGNHFEITAECAGMTARIIIEKSAIENSRFRWFYYSNPNDAAVGLVERSSTVENFDTDLVDIFDKRRFDSDYLTEIKD